MKHIFLILLVTFHIALNILSSQSNAVDLIRVEFWNPQGNHDKWIKIKDDITGNNMSEYDYKTRAWIKGSNGAITTKPVAYVSGCSPRIGACFKKTESGDECSPVPGIAQPVGLFAQGELLDQNNMPTGMKLPVKQLVSTGSTNTYEYVPESVTTALQENKVQYFEKIKVKWKWAPSENSTEWEDAGVSENPLYVIYDDPKVEASATGYLHFHTLLYIGCKYGNAATSNQELVDKVWTHFQSRNVRRADGGLMKYYANWTGPLASRTDDLIKGLDGRCQSWTKLFLDVFKCQGFQQTDNYIQVKQSVSQGFLVNTWVKTVVDGTSGNATYPFENTYVGNQYLNNNYNWQKEEVKYNGTQAQGNDKPVADFNLHVIAKVLNKFYDPSYAVTYNSSIWIIDQGETVEVIPEFLNVVSGYFVLANVSTKYHIQFRSNNSIDYFKILTFEDFPEFKNY